MSNRLLSLLTEIERALVASEPAPDGGKWDTLRLINFAQGLARLTIAVKSSARVTSARGSILLQAFTLADGSECLKTNLCWQGVDNTSTHAVYSQPQTDWSREAAQIAAKWREGQQTGSKVPALVEGQSPEPVLEATG
jgi:hypothetical protein